MHPARARAGRPPTTALHRFDARPSRIARQAVDVPATPQLTSRDRRALRTHVLAELDRLDAELAALDDDASDGAVAALRAERDGVRHSLDLIDELGYGVCAVCRGFIGIERLMALPSTTSCFACAR